eukprot:Gb_34369 [translate_table: standard]
MGDSTGRWSWQLPAFEKRKSFEMCDDEDVEGDWGRAVLPTAASKSPPLDRRYSISTMAPQAEVSRHRMHNLVSKVQKLKERVLTAQEDCLELRQEASDLQEYSNAKITRLTRYLGVLAEKARNLDQITLETEARIAPLIKERKKLFNDLLAVKGNIRVFCRVRPQFEHEGPSATEFPDDFTIRISPGGDSLNNSKKDFEFDRVYGPHVGQGDFFQEIQPLIQSALDGYNVSIFAYGQTGSGKTHTMEGPGHDRGVYFRAFEELFDLSNADSTSTSTFSFHITMLELHNEKVHDLLSSDNGNLATVQMGPAGSSVELVQEKVENPTDFARVLKWGLQNRGMGSDNSEWRNCSHLIVTIHIHYSNTLAEEDLYSKLSLVDMAGSERLPKEEASGDRITELLHVSKSLSAVGDVISALSTKKEYIPYANSRLTQILSDSLGYNSKTLIILHISPSPTDVQETISSLSFAARVRNVELSLGNRDTIKKWRDVANETRKELYEKEKEVSELSLEVMGLKKALNEADDQCVLLFNEVQKAWKVAFTLQADLKTESVLLAEKSRIEKDQNVQLRNQVAHLLKVDQDQKVQLQERVTMIQSLETKVKELEQMLSDAQAVKDREKAGVSVKLASATAIDAKMHRARDERADASAVTVKLEEELSKRDELIERLHEENEKLFERLTDRSVSEGSPKASRPPSRGLGSVQSDGSIRNDGARTYSPDQYALSTGISSTTGTVALLKSDSKKIKSTPAGEYLTAALLDFNPDQYDSSAAIADGANKLLMLVLAAVIKAGAAREHEMLAEIREAVFSFLRKLEAMRVMDAMLVSRVRILYIRSLLSRSPELQSIKVPPVERFLVKAPTGRSRSSSRGSSPGRSPVRHDSNVRKDLTLDHIQGFRVSIKQEKKSRFSSIVLKLRGIDQETWQQHVTGGKLREITEEARNYAIGNKSLAALFVHTPAGELQRQIRAWLAENFDFLSVTGGDAIGGVAGQLELLSTAIMDGWMAGLGAPQRPSTDALGQLLSVYTKQVYMTQLQHLKDVAGTLAMEEAEDLNEITKLRSGLESIEHKRRKLLHQMRTDVALLTKEEGGSPVRNPSTAAEDARLASLISLEDILKQVEDIKKEALYKVVFQPRKKAMLGSLDELLERMSSLLSIDHPCVQKHISEVQKLVESIQEKKASLQRTSTDESGQIPSSLDWSTGAGNDVVQWSVLQFNTGSAIPFVIKCGATSNSELIVKAPSKGQEKNSKEIITVVPKPSELTNLDLEEMKQVISQLPEALCQLALARTADGTRARYSRLYKTLAMRVPSMRSSINELVKDESSRDVLNPSTPSNRPAQLRRKTESDNLSDVTR